VFKRVVDAWPYALSLVAGFVAWSTAIPALLSQDPSQTMGVIVLWIYILQPLALLIGGIALGFRRGFDWVTVVVCLAVYVLGLGILGLSSDDPGFFTSYAGPSVLAFFLPAVLVGTGIGVGVRGLSRRTAGSARS
jgi:hypothetical protein